MLLHGMTRSLSLHAIDAMMEIAFAVVIVTRDRMVSAIAAREASALFTHCHDGDDGRLYSVAPRDVRPRYDTDARATLCRWRQAGAQVVSARGAGPRYEH